LPAEVGLPPSNAEEATQTVSNARDRMLALLEAYRIDFKEYDEADSQHIAACSAQAVFRAKAGAFLRAFQCSVAGFGERAATER